MLLNDISTYTNAVHYFFDAGEMFAADMYVKVPQQVGENVMDVEIFALLDELALKIASHARIVNGEPGPCPVIKHYVLTGEDPGITLEPEETP